MEQFHGIDVSWMTHGSKGALSWKLPLHGGRKLPVCGLNGLANGNFKSFQTNPQKPLQRGKGPYRPTQHATSPPPDRYPRTQQSMEIKQSMGSRPRAQPRRCDRYQEERVRTRSSSNPRHRTPRPLHHPNDEPPGSPTSRPSSVPTEADPRKVLHRQALHLQSPPNSLYQKRTRPRMLFYNTGWSLKVRGHIPLRLQGHNPTAFYKSSEDYLRRMGTSLQM